MTSNIIIYVHEPTAPPSFLDLNLLKGKKLNGNYCVLQSSNQIYNNFNLIDGFVYRYPEKLESGSTFSNNSMTIPGFQIENLTCARLCGFNNILEA